MKSISAVARRVALASFGLCVLLSLAAQARAQDVGYVLDISGDWYLNGATRLARTARLPANGVIRAGAQSEVSNFIVVANRSGAIIARRACNKPGECDSQITLPPASEPSVARRLFETVADWWNGNTEKYVTAAPKGDDINEAVVKLENNVLNLEPVFKNMEGGTYHLRFEPLAQGGTAASSPAAVLPFKWEPGQATSLGACGLKPDMYRLSLLAPGDDDFNETGMEAWVLVTSAERYDSAAKQFGEAMSLAQQWGNQVKPNTVRSFLRANLDLLATQQR